MSVYKTSCLCGDVTMEINKSAKPIGQTLCQLTHQHTTYPALPSRMQWYSYRAYCEPSRLATHSTDPVSARCSCVRAGHCKNCTTWHGTPIAGAIIYSLTNDDSSQPHSPLRLTSQPLIHSYSKTGSVYRHFCTHCGSHLFLSNPQFGLVILQPGQWRFSGLLFEPEAHVNYDNCQVKVPDGLKKFKDFPVAQGGSGEECGE